jgi:tetratricopeptide (TPR) repeat protein
MEAALIEYDKALAVEPDNATILLKAAKTLIALGKNDDAIARLRRATEKNPNYITPHVELALLAGPEEALPHLIEAIAINPFDPRIHKRLADVYAAQGNGAGSSDELAVFNQLTR